MMNGGMILMIVKEGMYVRTKYSDRCNIVAIRKIDEIDKGDNEMWLDDDVVDDYGDFYNNVYEQDIEIASENIVDVIKPGDYVNGKKVVFIDEDYNVAVDENDITTRDFEGRYEFLTIKKEDIKSIVTKEQFKNMEYEVE